MRKSQSGFTLVEIAIVLVIIGLLLGGVLKGQELITQAKIKNIANDFNGMSAAVYAYQDRYRKYPGDDNGASGRWSGSTSGGGDTAVGSAGLTSATVCVPTDTTERCAFWNHLRRAGFIAGDAASAESPQNAMGGYLHVQNGGFGLSGLVICTTNLPGKVAGSIDAQFDDGRTNTGTVRGAVGLETGTPAASGNYTDDGATVYSICKAI
jgi:prepilin-type N-terminal cleavage/methylation domain-containing protein